MSSLIWVVVSAVSITMLCVVLAVAGLPVPLFVSAVLFFGSAVIGLSQIGRG